MRFGSNSSWRFVCNRHKGVCKYCMCYVFWNIYLPMLSYFTKVYNGGRLQDNVLWNSQTASEDNHISDDEDRQQVKKRKPLSNKAHRLSEPHIPFSFSQPVQHKSNQYVSKGWNTCSSGFQNRNQHCSTKECKTNTKKTKGIKKVPAKYLNIEGVKNHEFISNAEKVSSKDKSQEIIKSSKSDVSFKSSRNNSLLVEIQNIQSVFQQTNSTLPKKKCSKGVQNIEFDLNSFSSVDKTNACFQKSAKKDLPKANEKLNDCSLSTFVLSNEEDLKLLELTNDSQIQTKYASSESASNQDDYMGFITTVDSDSIECDKISTDILGNPNRNFPAHESDSKQNVKDITSCLSSFISTQDTETKFFPSSDTVDITSEKSGENLINCNEEADIKNSTSQSNEDILTSTQEIESFPSTPGRKLSPCYRGSTWLQAIEWQEKTPVKFEELYNQENYLIKRKKKFVVGGFAEQAQRLGKRETSNRAMWSYQKLKGRYDKGFEGSLMLKIAEYHFDEGFIIANCKIITLNVIKDEDLSRNKNNHASNISNLLDKNKEIFETVSSSKSTERNISAYKSVPLVLQGDDTKSEQSNLTCIILFNPRDFNKLQLHTGSSIRIFPPWQTLHIATLFSPIILCTYFIQVLNNVPEQEFSEKEDCKTEEILYLRTCHCQIDPAIDFCQCLGMQEFENASFQNLQYDSLQCDGSTILPDFQKSVNSTSFTNIRKEKVNITDPEYMSHCILNAELPTQSSSHCLSDNINVNAPQNPNGHILPAVQLAGGCNVWENKVTIRGRIQRIWHYVKPHQKFAEKSAIVNNIEELNWNKSFSLLLQDSQGVFCELQLPDLQPGEDNNQWWNIIHNGEGKCYWFNGIKVSKKLNSVKYPTLFAVLRNIYDSQINNKEMITWHPFSFLLTAYPGDTTVSLCKDYDNPKYYPPQMLSLKSIILTHKKFKRFSCIVKIIWQKNMILYVTDRSLLERDDEAVIYSYMKIYVCSQSVKPEELIPVDNKSVILVSEANFQGDVLYIDKYSRISVFKSTVTSDDSNPIYYNHLMSPQSLLDLSLLQLKYIPLRTIEESTKVGDLVIIEGTISGVDGEKSISWLQCDICYQENLFQDASSNIYCEDCNNLVGHPIQNMKMEVLVHLFHTDKVQVQITLLLTTTKSLLPTFNNTQPQFAVSDVLKKKIGPLICCVETQEITSEGIKFYLKEIS